ncbi:hypothetical protein B0F90DRAFT_1726125 [Multifurca ochricompacta]|uniref:Ubiquitin 3 binding protein But2 C-terminal domain-containing protein n=1 Tax=Multifurca ochricompacta TaxID=376703 RepID=A0AAD4QN39_9AGAM|nr:hypothetical protein B0F90DRAFT_1726125 [Multifurca ochricompacta]
MWRRNYNLLPQDKNEDDFNRPERSDPAILSSGTKAFLRYGLIIIAACTALDSILLLALGYRYTKTVLFHVDPRKLETPSTYINFDLLYRNGTKTNLRFPSIQGLPRALAQVSSREPDKVDPQWPVSYLAPYGSVPYNDRHLLVEPEISTFVQFRVLDYGMENCSLALHIPEYGSETMEIARIGSTIDVWSLAVDSKVDLLEISFRTLPRRVSKIGTFTPRFNTTELLPSFTCQSGTYHAFLLTCPEGARKENCWVDLTSVKEKPVGLYMVQHQTI